MKIFRSKYFFLFILFFTVLLFRMYFVTENYNSEAYFHLRHINYILEEKSILYFDELSFGGKYVLYPHFFHIFMALFSLGNMFLLKFIPEFFLAGSVFLFYLIAKELSKNNKIVLFSCLIYSFTPLFLVLTTNVLSVYSLIVPLFLLAIYCFLKINERRVYLYGFMISVFLLGLTHISSFLLVGTSLLFTLMCISEDLILTKLKKEALFFCILIISFLLFITYHKVFFVQGLGLLFQNLDTVNFSIIADNNLVNLILLAGLLPIVLSLFAFYNCFFKKKSELVFLLSSLLLGILFLFVLGFMNIKDSLIYLTISFCLLSCYGLDFLLKYTEKFRWNKTKYFLVFLVILAFFMFSFYPSLYALDGVKPISSEKINDFLWLKRHSDSNDVVLSLENDGFIITAIANRRNVIDNDYLLAPNLNERKEDIKLLYKGWYLGNIKGLIEKYNIKWIYLPDELRVYGIEDLIYARNSDCFIQRGNFYEVVC